MKNKYLLLLCILFFANYSFAQSIASYTVTFTSNWSQATHPHSSGNLPAGAHWTKLVGATHTDQIVFLEMGGTATQGVENVAEQGNNTVFFNEVNAAITANFADQFIDGDDLSSAEGEIIISGLLVSEEYPLLTLLSMIAPSPDWMIAINSISLIDGNGDWIDEINLNLYPYDAGTDSGVDYTSPDNDTNPQEPISSLQGVSPFSNEIIGTINIQLNLILGNEDVSINEAALFPNPATETVTISNENPLQSVIIYNVLGVEVLKMSDINTTAQQIDISTLPSGMYLVKIKDSLNNTAVKQLIKH